MAGGETGVDRAIAILAEQIEQHHATARGYVHARRADTTPM